MKVTVNVGDLINAYNNVSRAVPVRTTIGIVEGVLLEAENKQLKLTATDTRFRVEASIDSDNHEEGKVVASARIMDMLKSLPKDEFITIESKDGKVVFDCIGSHVEAVSEDPEEFPKAEQEKGTEVVMPSDTLKVMIESTAFAASNDEARGALTGCLFEAHDKKVRMVAIDGFRMAIRDAESDVDIEFSAVIGAWMLREITRLLQEDDTTVKIGRNTAEFTCGNVKATTKLLTDPFPKYQDIIPKSFDGKAVLEKSAIIPSLERAVMITEGVQRRLVKLDIGDTFKIAARGDLGLVDESVAADKTGADIVIGFNGGYLKDGLKALQGDTVTLEYTEPLKPMEMKEENYEYLVLPVRL